PVVHRVLHPFPTRRSSDLGPQQAAGGSHFAHAEEIVELIGPIGLDEHRRRGTVDRRTAVVPPADGREVVVGEVDAHLLRGLRLLDRKSTRLNSSHVSISYA